MRSPPTANGHWARITRKRARLKPTAREPVRPQRRSASSRRRARPQRSGHPVDTLSGYTENVRAIAFSPDGRLLAFGNNNHSELVRVDGGRSIAILKWSRAHSLAFSPDGKTLAISGIGGDVGLCDVAKGRVTAKLGEEVMFSGPSMVYSLAFSPDGKTLVVAHTAPGSATVRVWDLATRRIRTTLAGAVSPVVFSPDGKLLAAAAYGVEGGVQLWKAP